MTREQNLLNHAHSTLRSMGEVAAERIFIAKATDAGFYLFSKIWCDMPYDVVLDYQSTLFRVEVKGSLSDRLDLTRGSRAGVQIDRTGPDKQRPITRQDCDFVVGVQGSDSTCYIIPVEVVEILAQGKTVGGHSVNIRSLEQSFRERWDFFTGGRLQLPPQQILSGFRTLSSAERAGYLQQLNVPLPLPLPYRIPRTKIELHTAEEVETLFIWQNLGS